MVPASSFFIPSELYPSHIVVVRPDPNRFRFRLSLTEVSAAVEASGTELTILVAALRSRNWSRMSRWRRLKCGQARSSPTIHQSITLRELNNKALISHLAASKGLQTLGYSDETFTGTIQWHAQSPLRTMLPTGGKEVSPGRGLPSLTLIREGRLLPARPAQGCASRAPSTVGRQSSQP
jgi:hypothetical protein